MLIKYADLPFPLRVLKEENSTELIGNYYSLKELLQLQGFILKKDMPASPMVAGGAIFK